MPRDIPSHWNQETDVAVVGGGGSGLAAALEASSQGAAVVLLEKRPHLGGTTPLDEDTRKRLKAIGDLAD